MSDIEAACGEGLCDQIALFDYLSLLFWQAVNGEREARLEAYFWLYPEE